MPYQIKRRTAVIDFKGTDYDGAEMRCRFDVEMETFLSYQRMIDDASIVNVAEMFKQFGDEIVLEWNLEDEGKQIAADGAGMMKLPVQLATEIIKRWLEAMATPSAPLSLPSKNGATSEEASTETATP